MTMPDDTQQRRDVKPRPDVLDGVSRRTLLKASGVGAGGLALGASGSSVAAQEEDGENDTDEGEGLEDVRIPQLHLDTLEAELAGETLQVESSVDSRPGSTTYVGEAAGRPGLFVAVSHLPGNADRPEGDEQPDVTVYLCDGEVGARTDLSLWIAGAFDDTGMTFTGTLDEGTLPPADGDDDESPEVKLALVDGEFLGVATIPGEDPILFVASEATGTAGLYRADSEEHTIDGDPGMIRWIVLADDRQRGSTCVGVRVRSVCIGVSW